MTKPIKSAAALTLAVSILLTLTGCSGKPDAVPTPTAAVQETPTPTPEPTPRTYRRTGTDALNRRQRRTRTSLVITVVDATEPSDMKAGNVVDIRGVVKTDKGSSRMSRAAPQGWRGCSGICLYAVFTGVQPCGYAERVHAFCGSRSGGVYISADRRGGKQGRDC